MNQDQNETNINPLVSIIVPVYNVRPFLEKAAGSVLQQTYPNWEMILVDDGSTDGSGSLCDEYAAADPRIRVIHRTNGGLSAARNTGLSAASGQYLQFLDSDDWLEKEALEKCVRLAVTQDAGMVIFDEMHESGAASWHERSPFNEGVHDSREVLRALVKPLIPPYVHNKFCRRELYAGVVFPEGEKWEDAATTYLPVSRSQRIYVLNEALYHYRQREDAISKEAAKDQSVHRWRYIQYLKRYRYLRESDPETAEIAKESILRNGLKYYALYLKPRGQKEEMRNVRDFLCSGEMRHCTGSIRLKAAYILFRICPGLFCRIMGRE